MSRLGRSQPVQPSAWHGFVDPGPAAVGTVPPRAVVVPHDPRPRQFYVPQLSPIVISGALTSFPPAAVLPPAPVTVEVPRRASALNPLQPIATHGFVASGVGVPGTTPPASINVDRVDQRGRYRLLDPIAISAALRSVTAAPVVLPSGPFVVPLDERRRFLATLPPTIMHGPVSDPTAADGNMRTLVGVGT